MNNTSKEIDLFTAETMGASKDRPLRPALEESVRDFFEAIAKHDWDTLDMYFTDDATLVAGLSAPGDIHIGCSKIIDWFREEADDVEKEFIVPKLIVVDRGRITCHIVRFTFTPDDSSKSPIEETSNVVILDIVKAYISRMEYRWTTEEPKQYPGGQNEMEKMVKDAKEASVVLDNTA